MCGVPHHAAEAYLARLIRRGFRVAVVEQTEDPKTRSGKAPIRREVVRLITPGTVTEEALLEAGRPNLLLALARDPAGLGAAWIDVSTGLFETTAVALPELMSCLVVWNRPKSWRRGARSGRMGEHTVTRTGRLAASDRAAAAGRGVRRSQPGCVRHLPGR